MSGDAERVGYPFMDQMIDDDLAAGFLIARYVSHLFSTSLIDVDMFSTGRSARFYFMVGIAKSAPARIPVGQRDVIVFNRV
jgi:hypothetical protein